MPDLEKALEKAKYTALPLPREMTAPSTIYSFIDGQLFIVRNPHTCLPDPPLSITVDRSADTVQFTKEFSFSFNAVVSFLAKIFSIGNAKAELNAKAVSSATVIMSGLQHETLQTGELIEFLAKAQRTPCLHDITDKHNYTVVAALKAASFTYTFKNSAGITVGLSIDEAKGLFEASGDAQVSTSSAGQVVVKAPRYVGVVSWNGDKIANEVKRAKQYIEGRGLVAYTAPTVFALAATREDIFATRNLSLGASARTALAHATGSR